MPVLFKSSACIRGGNALNHASCHTGARLLRSPGASLALHPTCRVLAAMGRLTLRMRSLQTWATHSACRNRPASLQDTQGATLSGTREGHKDIHLSISPLSLPTFFSPFSIVQPFPSVFQTGLSLFLWYMCLIISFQSQGEDRGRSQFRTIALTGETVSSTLPKGKGAGMDLCYKCRGGDNWWCLLARWLHSVFAPWQAAHLLGPWLCRASAGAAIRTRRADK